MDTITSIIGGGIFLLLGIPAIIIAVLLCLKFTGLSEGSSSVWVKGVKTAYVVYSLYFLNKTAHSDGLLGIIIALVAIAVVGSGLWSILSE